MRLIQRHYNETDGRRWPGHAGRAARKVSRPTKDTLSASLLTTQDFFNILEQYETAYPDFRALGAVPANFCDLTYTKEVCRLSLRQMLTAGKRRAAVVFNTDPGHRGGQHWVMLWIDTTRPTTDIAYFDSEAEPPAPEIKALMERLHAEARRMHAQGKLPAPRSPRNAVRVRHQRGGRECGIYCIFFVDALLRGTPIARLSGRPRITNAAMRRFMHTELFPAK